MTDRQRRTLAKVDPNHFRWIDDAFGVWWPDGFDQLRHYDMTTLTVGTCEWWMLQRMRSRWYESTLKGTGPEYRALRNAMFTALQSVDAEALVDDYIHWVRAFNRRAKGDRPCG